MTHRVMLSVLRADARLQCQGCEGVFPHIGCRGPGRDGRDMVTSSNDNEGASPGKSPIALVERS